MKPTGKTKLKLNITDIQTISDKTDVHIRFPQVEFGPYALSKIKASQCKVACPIDQNVKAYIGLIAAGKFDKALEVIKRTNPFPAICGRVCIHPCEMECNRGEFDKPIAIHSLKRFVADYEIRLRKTKREKLTYKPQSSILNSPKIAIIGSGPAGLTAASDLARLGYRITVFEALSVLGGMLSVGVPDFRLPKEIIKTEIEAILDLGIKVKTNTKVGKDIVLNDLIKNGYKAVFIATGAHNDLKLGIPGEDKFKGVIYSLEFLRRVNLGDKSKPGRIVVVIGGGHPAIDSARTALRLGCDDVHLVYSKSRNEMPVDEQEIDEAEIEGVKIHYLTSPINVLGNDGKVNGLECIKLRLSEPDIVGRRQPITVENSNFVISADVIIPAMGQEPDLSWLPENHGFESSRWNCFVVDPDTLATNLPGFFAGGDTVTGPKTVIEAIAAGHKAAISIDRYLMRKDLKIVKEPIEVEESELIIEDLIPEEKKRIRIPTLLPKSRKNNFREVELLPTDEQTIEEAKRCLMCGPCNECVECIKDCQNKLITVSIPKTIGQEILIRIPWVPERFPLDEKPWDAIIESSDMKNVSVVVEPVVCNVIEEFCRGCGRCGEICEYSVITIEENVKSIFVAKIDQSTCRGCGACAAICPSGAIQVGYFTDLRINETIEKMLQR
ncbi:MAG: FAD-dependent oxidoreductase [Candidatus Cloacimonetes bacterium]|nr:FAD-dependent oxidoreductase [Candidatus Cloacimonadota bacterium]